MVLGAIPVLLLPGVNVLAEVCHPWVNGCSGHRRCRSQMSQMGFSEAWKCFPWDCLNSSLCSSSLIASFNPLVEPSLLHLTPRPLSLVRKNAILKGKRCGKEDSSPTKQCSRGSALSLHSKTFAVPVHCSAMTGGRDLYFIGH